jgi:hypothetical protein
MINDQKIEVVEKYKYLGVNLAYRYIIINGNLKHAADQLLSRRRDSSDVRRLFVRLAGTPAS